MKTYKEFLAESYESEDELLKEIYENEQSEYWIEEYKKYFDF